MTWLATPDRRETRRAPKSRHSIRRGISPSGTTSNRSTRRSAPSCSSVPRNGYGSRASEWGTILSLILAAVVTYLLMKGVGIWGINVPVGWCFAITSFVWWIGIGHAGTLISAILLLLHQKWRTSINRIAEAMTIFAVMCAGLFPLLHLGRPWYFYWLLPYPNTMRLWPQFRSASCGTCSRSARTSRFRCSSGTWA